jgi:hypothetical protein
MRHRTVLALGLVSLTSIFAACGSDNSGGGSSGSSTGSASGSGSGSASGSASGSSSGSGSTGTSSGSGSGSSGSSSGSLSDASTTDAPAGDAASYAGCPSPNTGSSASSTVKYVFVIAMENHDSTQILGSGSAPYINKTLIPCYASSSNFNDPLALPIPSEPHYVYMEAGTNSFPDPITFTNDDDPSAGNSTSSTLHLSTQLTAAHVTWRSYQEDISTAATGDCPINSSGFYAAKHDPFVFFQDVAGSPPSATNSTCADHHKPFSALAGDLIAGGAAVAQYNFITPNLCNDMHGAGGCPDSDSIKSGDDWLAANLPGLITFVNANNGVIFLVWDEGSVTLKIPFVAIGPSVKRNYVGSVSYDHGSLVVTNERIFGVPKLATVASKNDFADLFLTGALP